jgi:mannitol-1-/sugar-/sorbitol-6-/2-deoxyglucose-6-phosphatase
VGENFVSSKNNFLMDISNYETVIYDMDGVLIDSEPVWKIAMEEVFSEVGCNLTRKDFEKTVGLRLDEVIHYWYNINPWDYSSPEEVLDKIIQKMVEYISADGVELEGVTESLQFFKQKGFKIGLATSSYRILIETVLTKLNIRHYFDFTHSAEDEEYGKPHPAVYLSVAKQLKSHPLKCLVIEDSINGVIAGKAARMTVICIPEKSHHPNPKLCLADFTFSSLSEMLKSIKK